MHEMSLVEGIVQLVEEAARADGCARVKAVWLEIGQLAAVETEALRFCFDAVARDTIADGARLEIIGIPGQGWCMKCEAAVAIAALYEACPVCGGYQIQVTGGDTMRVKELEVE
ncbi:MAG: hydrogenase maturation nickel metallochaperone HypA [Proteobacteria bacterium]|nr:hydrogenase maturation nickel metallochaperone HypA [Pseudomonadota bacterium]